MQFFADLSLRRNTKRTYAAHHRLFAQLSIGLRIDPRQPMSEQQLCLVIAAYARHHKITTVGGFVSALVNLAQCLGHPELPRSALYTRFRTGLDNYYADTNVSHPKHSITLSDLCSFYPHMQVATFSGARDWCACVFAFFGLLRINEYTNGALRMEHVQVLEWGVRLTIPFSKTSLAPTQVELVRRHDQLCPARAWERYHALRPLRGLSLPGDPVFVTDTAGTIAPLTDREFITRIRAVILLAFNGTRDVSDFAGHSFRRGGASAMQLAGVPDSVIQTHGRWQSDAYRVYLDVQHSSDMRRLATSILRDHPVTGLGRTTPRQ